MIRIPDFFIVGAPKCGTTSMDDYLKQHPEIFVPERKEIHFFGTDFRSRHFLRNAEKYRALFTAGRDSKRVGETSSMYLYSRVAATQIKEFSPAAKIIIMLRNPVDMIYALHAQFVISGFENLDNFEDALNAEQDRQRGVGPPNAPFPLTFLCYREVATYTPQIRRFIEAFGRENIHFILFDDLARAPADVYRDTLRFLDVDEEFQPDLKVLNAAKRARIRALRGLFARPPDTLVRLARAVVPEPFRPRVKAAIERSNIVYAPRPPMSPELCQRLQTELAPEVERLGELLHRDLSHWCRVE